LLVTVRILLLALTGAVTRKRLYAMDIGESRFEINNVAMEELGSILTRLGCEKATIFSVCQRMFCRSPNLAG
jgi:hypothetical protein